MVVAHERTILWRRSRAILNTHRNGKGEDGGENSKQTDPGQPTDLSECLNAGETEANYSSDGDIDGGTRRVIGK